MIPSVEFFRSFLGCGGPPTLPRVCQRCRRVGVCLPRNGSVCAGINSRACVCVSTPAHPQAKIFGKTSKSDGPATSSPAATPFVDDKYRKHLGNDREEADHSSRLVDRCAHLNSRIMIRQKAPTGCAGVYVCVCVCPNAITLSRALHADTVLNGRAASVSGHAYHRVKTFREGPSRRSFHLEPPNQNGLCCVPAAVSSANGQRRVWCPWRLQEVRSCLTAKQEQAVDSSRDRVDSCIVLCRSTLC